MTPGYLTIDQRFTGEAVAYLDRADDQRLRGNQRNARGLERKCLRKLEKSFKYRVFSDRNLRLACGRAGVSADAPLGLD